MSINDKFDLRFDLLKFIRVSQCVCISHDYFIPADRYIEIRIYFLFDFYANTTNFDKH